MKVRDLSIEDIAVGDSASFDRMWTEEDLENFAKLSGNKNPFHVDENFAASTRFGQKIMYGMHVAVVCSTLVGMYLPGKNSICLRQDLSFKKPIFVGDTTRVKGVVKSKSLSTGILDISISVTKGDEVVVVGTMTTQIMKK